jgi:SNF2 family DNA or RNA helicase
LEEVLEALGTGELLADVNGIGECEWHLAEDNPPRQMSITGLSNGIQVKINHLFGFQGNQHNIYFHDRRIYRTPHRYLEPIWDFLKCMADIPSRTVLLQKEDVPVFCRELLPVLEQFFECTRENFYETDYGVLPVEFEIYLDAPQRDFITCRVMAIYGENQYNIYADQDQLQMRDQVKEAQIKSLVSSLCNAFDDKESLMVVAEDEDKLYDFLVYGIPKLQEIAEVFVSDALKRLKIISAPKVAVGVAITGDIMNLSMTSDDISREQLFEILSKYNRKKKFYRLKNGDFVNVTGEELESLLQLKQGLHLTDAQLKQSTIEIPRFRALYLDAELRERASISVSRDKEFKALVRNMKTVEDNDFDIPTSLENILREYQKRGYLWIKTLQNNGFGGILADDMGLGKTLQVICYLLAELLEAAPKDNRRALIICPASLVYNWKSEVNKFAPQLTVKMVVGTAQERIEVIQNADNMDILITSYDLIKRDIESYEQINFHSEIIDEAQYIKNSNTQAAKAVKKINSVFKLALTGTPIENRLSELWSIFDYLMPGFLYSYQRFRDELELAIIQKGDEAAIRRLQRMITPFVLRRLKKDVLTHLPEQLEESIYATMEGEQQKLYDAHVKKLQILLGRQSEDEFKNSKLQLLSELTRLRQLCCDPTLLYEDYSANSAKTELCMDLIQNAVSGGHKILLFSQFTSMLERLQQCLFRENISFYSLTGATSKENRTKMVEAFNQDATSVFCISLKAGGTGLNLTSADIVIHFDPWWNLAVQNQATDRAHRIGQTNIVNVYKLIVQGTIEENIMKLQDKKKDLAEQVLGGEGMNVGSFTKEELLELLR